MPFDNIKTRMQSAGHDYKGMLDCAVRILREDGVAAFWRGTSPRLVRLTVSYQCLDFRSLELMTFRVAIERHNILSVWTSGRIYEEAGDEATRGTSSLVIDHVIA